MTYNVYKLFKIIRKRPGMYVGKVSLFNISTFLTGYAMAMSEINAIEISNPEFSDFHSWIAKKFGYFESTAGWSNMILAVSVGHDPQTVQWEDYDEGVTDEQHIDSVQLFFKLIDEYQSKKNAEQKH